MVKPNISMFIDSHVSCHLQLSKYSGADYTLLKWSNSWHFDKLAWKDKTLKSTPIIFIWQTFWTL